MNNIFILPSPTLLSPYLQPTLIPALSFCYVWLFIPEVKGLTLEEVDQVASDFLDGEIVDLASDWLGNTVSIGDSVYLWVQDC